MRQIASALNVSAMTPYHYFQDKDDILAAVRARGFERFATALESASQRAEDLRTRGFAIAGAYLDFALGSPDTYKLMFDLNQSSDRDYPELAAASARAKSPTHAWVREMIAAKVFKGEAEEIGDMYWASIHGAVVLELAGKMPPGSARRVQKTFAKTLFNGLRAEV